VIGRKLILGAMALGLCLAVTPSGVLAAPCPKKCKAEISTCTAACTAAGLVKKDLKKCKKGCKKGIVKACHTAKNPTACSPSGAFLD
jgi:hypothetical protein